VLGRGAAAGLARGGAGGLPGDGPQANSGQKRKESLRGKRKGFTNLKRGFRKKDSIKKNSNLNLNSSNQK
jgi:hypothetical protein